MQWFFDLFSNQLLITAVSSLAVAQIVKSIIYAIINKKIEFNRLIGDGGMPSGHSATVTSLATMSALMFGFNSFEFAVTTILAIIVCHDATGVRRETGKQTVLLNELVKAFEILAKHDLPEVKLKELVGHTPLQVFAGMGLGIINAIILYFLIF